MKARFYSNKNEARETFYLVLMLLVLGTFSSVLYLIPLWILLTGFIAVMASLFAAEIIVDHTSFRSKRIFKTSSQAKNNNSNPYPKL